jgi:hypothetical protein
VARDAAADLVEAGILSFEMTKVTLHYDLVRPLGEPDLDHIEKLHSVYGIARVKLAPTLDKIIVDYDASRLMKTDVEAQLARHDIPIRTTAMLAAD